MRNSLGNKLAASSGIWTPHLILLACTVFFEYLGQGLLRGMSTNFFVETLSLSGTQVLWLAGFREIPGLALMFIAALIMRLPLSRRAAVSLLLMGVGYGLYALVQSYLALIAVAILASLGFHNWMPLQSALGMGLCSRKHCGRILGSLTSVGSLASIVGMGIIVLLADEIPLRGFAAIGGAFIVLGGVLVARLPTDIGDTEGAPPRLLISRRYWLYYVLTFFEGSRTQVFGTFGTLILVQYYGLTAREISLLLLASGVVNFLVTPQFGYLIDRFGERLTLSASYVGLALCFAGYATIHNVWFLGAALIAINLLVMLHIGLSTYVRRIAPDEELTPTLSAGVSINHITSVSMSLLAGTLLSIVGYEGLCWGAAAIIMASVPFALALRAAPETAPQPRPAAAK